MWILSKKNDVTSLCWHHSSWLKCAETIQTIQARLRFRRHGSRLPFSRSTLSNVQSPFRHELLNLTLHRVDKGCYHTSLLACHQDMMERSAACIQASEMAERESESKVKTWDKTSHFASYQLAPFKWSRQTGQSTSALGISPRQNHKNCLIFFSLLLQYPESNFWNFKQMLFPKSKAKGRDLFLWNFNCLIFSVF